MSHMRRLLLSTVPIAAFMLASSGHAQAQSAQEAEAAERAHLHPAAITKQAEQPEPPPAVVAEPDDTQSVFSQEDPLPNVTTEELQLPTAPDAPQDLSVKPSSFRTDTDETSTGAENSATQDTDPVTSIEPEALPESVIESTPLVATTAETGPSISTPVPPPAYIPEDSKNAPVTFSADSVSRDEAAGTIKASGRVEMEQSGRLLKADEVVYNVSSDKIHANGHVVLLDSNGDVHVADTIDLTDRMKVGNATNMRSTLHDGSRMWAENGNRVQAVSTTMTRAAYTPCVPCKDHPEKSPIWQIKASEVKHDELEHEITYKNATFDAFGVPILYMPYFSHPDGTITQKSGFLTPSFGYKSRQGFMVSNSYYAALSPYYDATLGLTAMSKQAPLVFGEYRRRYDNAQIKINSSLTYSTRLDDINGTTVTQPEKVRGHLFAKGLWDINNNWRAGTNIEYASDDQYLRQYDFSSKDVLEDQVYLERFSGRDYAVGRIMAFQDVRVQALKTDQPAVLPEIKANFLGEPADMLGGRWSFNVSTLGLLRDGSGQDLNRITTEAGWERRLVSDTGLLTNVQLDLRGDSYFVHDRTPDPTNPTISREGNVSRGFAQANIVSSYPLVNQIGEHTQMIVEPIASLTLSPNVSGDKRIPNEDSQDVQLDNSNIFEANRFPGYDRIEDGNHATYGIRTGLYGDAGSKGEIFLGQSYRFEELNNPFPVGSGLNRQYSDLVGEINANYQNLYTIDYRFALDSNDYRPRRHEVGLGANFGRLAFGTNYLYAKPVAGTLLPNREQIQGSASYKFSDTWQAHTYATRDLGVDAGLRNALFGVDYMAQCFNITGNLQRNLTDDSSGTSNTVIMFKIGLKNLGQFSTSGINLDSKSDTTSTSPSAK